MSDHATIPFALTGEYGGFVYTDEGKRRMRLQVGELEYLLKVPRPLRRRVAANFRAGQPLHVTGHEEHDEGSSKWIVAELWPVGTQEPSTGRRPFVPGPVRVCAKKNCWRQGGRELFEFLQQQAVLRGVANAVEIKAVGCMDHCKHAPNLQWQGHVIQRASLQDAKEIIDRLEGALHPAAPEPSVT